MSRNTDACCYLRGSLVVTASFEQQLKLNFLILILRCYNTLASYLASLNLLAEFMHYIDLMTLHCTVYARHIHASIRIYWYCTNAS